MNKNAQLSLISVSDSMVIFIIFLTKEEAGWININVVIVATQGMSWL